eukprot:Hpha_TRINITY_DN3804_c0_g1::TRINITY_DN3804_c0_g1_i1::g.44493::m.44493
MAATLSGQVQVTVRRYERGKSKGMKKAYKRFAHMDIADERAQIRFFKSDQELMPKEVLDLNQIAEPPRIGGDKKQSYFLTIAIGSSGACHRYKLQFGTREERDKWAEMVNDVCRMKPDDYLETFRERLADWEAELQAVSRIADLRLQFEVASFGALPAEEHAACFKDLAGGGWAAALQHAVSPLPPESKLIRLPLERICVRRPRGPGFGGGSYDKVSRTLHVHVEWDPHVRLVKLPTRELSDALSAPQWHEALDRSLEETPGWTDACNRLRVALGQPSTARVVCELSRTVTAAAADKWARRWLTPEHLSGVASAVEKAAREVDASSAHVPRGCPTPARAKDILAAWAQGVAIFADEARVSQRLPPLVRIHRAPSKHGDDSSGLSRQAIALFNRCRAFEETREETRGFPGALCASTVDELQSQIADVAHSARFVELARQAEKIQVAAEDAGQQSQLLFVVHWEDFVNACRELGCSARVRMRLAMQLVSQYPARAQTVAESLGGSMAQFSRLLPRVTVVFETDPPVGPGAGRTTAPEGCVLLDVVLLRREEREGGRTALVLAYDVDDLPSFAKGYLAGVFRPSPAAISVVAADAEDNSSDESSSSSSGDGEGTLATSSPVGRFGLGQRQRSHSVDVLAHLQQEVGPTPYADDGPLRDENVPREITIRAAQQPEAEYYPVDEAAVARCVEALKETFQPERISLHTMVEVILHAIAKLRRLFTIYDPDRTGGVQLSDFATVCNDFEEYENPGNGAELLVSQMNAGGTGRGVVRFSAAAPLVLERLLPQDVKQSVRCKRTVLLLGMPNTGKTLIVAALRQRPADRLEPTRGLRGEVVNVGKLNLNLSEIGGQPDERKNWSRRSKRLGAVHGVCFVVDAGRQDSLDAARGYLKEVLLSKHLRRVPVLVLLNNSLSRTAMDRRDVEHELRLSKYCNKGKQPFHVARINVVSPSDVSTNSVNPSLLSAFGWLVSQLEDKHSARLRGSPRTTPVLRPDDFAAPGEAGDYGPPIAKRRSILSLPP